MAQPYVYDKDAESYDNFGECGELTATEVEFEEIANGMSELTLTHPYDANGRWTYLKEGNIIKAEVPVRTLPPADNGTIATSVEVYTVRGSETPANRSLYTKPKKGKKKKVLPAGMEVAVTKSKKQGYYSDDRYFGTAKFEIPIKKGKNKGKIKIKSYSGWIPKDGVIRDRTENLPSDPEAIEMIAPSVVVRDQLFRIYKVQKTEEEVKVSARHVFYDALGDLTNFKDEKNELTCQQAIDAILEHCYGDSDLGGTTDMADKRVVFDWSHISPVEALLDPDEGVVNRWGGEIARDDYDFAILSNAGLNRGIRIEYGKNMLGVDCELDSSDVVTRVVPIGKDKKDKDLLLTAGTYHTNWGDVVVASDDEPWVDSPEHINDYPIPHIVALECSDAKEGKGISKAEARNMMANAAMEQFKEEQADLPALSVKVDFRLLGDTMEYQQYKDLESIHLYDRVRVFHPQIGVDVLAKVTSIKYDVLLECLTEIELESLRANLATASVMSWQIKKVNSFKLSGTLSGDMLGGANYSLVITSSSGDEVSGTTTLDAHVFYHTEDVTDAFDASEFAWYKDDVQIATGVKQVTVQYASLTGAARYVCEVGE